MHRINSRMIMMIMMANTTTMRHKKSDTCAQRQQEREVERERDLGRVSPYLPLFNIQL